MERRVFILTSGTALLAGIGLSGPVLADRPENLDDNLPPRTRGAHGLRSLWWEIFDASRDIGNLWGKYQGRMLTERLRAGRMLAAVERKLKSRNLSERDRKNLEALRDRLRKRFNRILEILTGKSAKFVSSRNAQAKPSPWQRAKVHTRLAEKAANEYKKAEPGTHAARSKLREAQKQLRTALRIIEQARAQFANELKGLANDMKKARAAGVATDVVTAKQQKAVEASAKALSSTKSAKAITKAINDIKIR